MKPHGMVQARWHNLPQHEAQCVLHHRRHQQSMIGCISKHSAVHRWIIWQAAHGSHPNRVHSCVRFRIEKVIRLNTSILDPNWRHVGGLVSGGQAILHSLDLDGLTFQSLWTRDFNEVELMCHATLRDMEGRHCLEYLAAPLNRHDSTRRKRASVPNTFNLILKINVLARQKKIPMQGVGRPVRWNRVRGCHQGLRQDVPPIKIGRTNRFMQTDKSVCTHRLQRHHVHQFLDHFPGIRLGTHEHSTR